MNDHLARAQLILLEIRRLSSEAVRTDDAARIRAIADEIEVLHDSMLEVRRDQLIERIVPSKKRRWWRRGERP